MNSVEFVSMKLMIERKRTFKDYAEQHPDGRDYTFSAEKINPESLNKIKKQSIFFLENVHKFVRFRKCLNLTNTKGPYSTEPYELR
jgi:hypothetical protein